MFCCEQKADQTNRENFEPSKKKRPDHK
jgi:hypothetical protein